MEDYVATITNWRNTWCTKTKHLAIKGCNSVDETIKTAIHKAHAPSVQRALKTSISTKEPRKDVAEYLQNEISDNLFKQDFTFGEYDEWARTICTQIRQIYRDYGITDYTYGNAQKMLNMAIKFLLSADNIDPALPIFKVAHIPIDGVIMGISKKKLGVNKMPHAWSKTDNFEDIIDYQRRFRTALPEDSFPLLWECVNWKND